MIAPQLDVARQAAADGDASVAVLSGKLVLETVHEFLRILRPERAAALILEMSGVSFIDSAGVGALAQLFVHRRGLNQKFALVGLSEQGRAVVEVCGLPKLIPCYASVSEAQDQLK